jgi:hypothetical protein
LYDNDQLSDYVILDIKSSEQKTYQDYFHEIINNPEYELIFEKRGILLYKRKASN